MASKRGLGAGSGAGLTRETKQGNTARLPTKGETEQLRGACGTKMLTSHQALHPTSGSTSDNREDGGWDRCHHV